MPPKLGIELDYSTLYTIDGSPIYTDRAISAISNECFLTNAEIERIKKHIENKPKPKRIIFHSPATIVFWQDGTKTVVKCMEGTAFNPYYGFVCALAKKVYGSNSAVNRIIRDRSEGESV